MTSVTLQHICMFLSRLLVGLCLVVFVSQTSFAAEVEINGVSGKLKKNVAAFLAAVPPPSNGNLDIYRQQLHKATAEALQALGYYRPEIVVEVEHVEKGTRAAVNIIAGQPVVLYTLSFEIRGAGQQDGSFQKMVAQQKLKQGAVFHHGHYESFKSSVGHLALSRGYFDAKWLEARVEIRARDLRAEATLVFDSGPRYRFGATEITGAPELEEFILSAQTYRADDFYLAELLSSYNAELLDSNYFRSVLARPDLAGRSDGVVSIAVQATPKADHIVSVGGGYSTDVGVRGKLKWTIPRMNQAGHSLVSDLEISAPEKSISSAYKIPLEDATVNFAVAQLGFERTDFEDTESSRFTWQIRRQRKLENTWLRSVFLRYEREDYRQGQQHDLTRLWLPGLSFARDRTEGGLNVHWGDRYQFYFEISDKIWGSDIRLFKVRGVVKWVRTAGKRNQHKVILRGDLGAIRVDSILQVPASMRFFTGGDQSIRGFNYETVAPKDDQGELIGGKYLTVGSLEYGYLIADNWRLAAFTDVGTATNDFREPLSVGSGIGLRWITPVGPLRFDLAFAVSDPDLPWMIHFSLGPDI